MASFLEWDFNCCLDDDKQEAIVTDFALQAQQLDGLVKEQMRWKAKDPQFSAEKTLYKVQDKLIKVAGPLPHSFEC